jgi:hypothetical protein
VINKIIKLLIGKIKCARSGHVLQDSVSCPFTGKSYRGCSRCGDLITL